MESCRSEPLKFDCNKKIDINPKEYWEEIMQLTFLNDKSEYLSLTRLSYEEEVYIVYNDRIYFLYSNVNNIRFRLDNYILTIEVDNPTRGNLPNTFTINIVQPFDNLEYILNLFFQKWCLFVLWCRSERNGIYSGYTTDGRIFYMKTILYPSGDHNFIGGMGALTIIYPKSYQQGVEPIVDVVQHWRPKKLRTN